MIVLQAVKAKIKISIVGKLNNILKLSAFLYYFKSNKGFSLIELIVVISLISIMLFVAIPKMQNVSLLDQTKKTSRFIIAKIQDLKAKSIQDHTKYILIIDIDTDSMWASNKIEEDELENSNKKKYKLPGNIKFSDVEFPKKGRIAQGKAHINFYPQGYSDKAIIHIQTDDDKIYSFLIEPFLSKVKLYKEYIGFEN